MNFHILHVSLFCNAYVALNCYLLMFFSLLFSIFLLILCNFVTYCFDLIARCSSALSTTNSTFNLTCVDNGPVNVYVCVCVCENMKVNFRLYGYCDYDHQCKRYQRNTSQCHLWEQFIWKQVIPLMQICYCVKYYIYICFMTVMYQWPDRTVRMQLSEGSVKHQVRVVRESHWHMQ